MLLENRQDGLGVLGLIGGVVTKQRLHVDGNQMPSWQCHQVSPEKREIVIDVGKDDKIQHLQCASPFHMSCPNLPQFRRAGAVTIGLNRILMFPFSHHC